MQTQGLSAICGIGLGADSEEKHEPASDIDTVVVDSLKALDPKWPIREADIGLNRAEVRKWPQGGHCTLRNSGDRLGDERPSEVVRMGGEPVSDFLAGGGEMGALTRG